MVGRIATPAVTGPIWNVWNVWTQIPGTRRGMEIEKYAIPGSMRPVAGTATTYSRDRYTASVPTGQSGTGERAVRGLY